MKRAILLLFAALPAMAQAWLPPRHTTTVAISYGYGLIKKHLAPPKEVDVGHIRWHEALLQIGYTFTDRLGVSASVPYIAARYRGPDPHPFSTVDNGHYHGTWQDYRVEARYQAISGGIALTPFLGLTVPTHDYTYFGHAAVGRDLREKTAGVYVGVADWLSRFRSCDCPTGTYLQSRLAYSSVERVIGIRHDRGTADVEVGYFVTEKLGVHALGSYNYTFGGIPFSLDWYGNVNDPRYIHHDQVLTNRYFNGGLGANYVISDGVDVFASALHTVSGVNGHKIHIAASAGVAWSFTPRKSR